MFRRAGHFDPNRPPTRKITSSELLIFSGKPTAVRGGIPEKIKQNRYLPPHQNLWCGGKLHS